MIGRQGGFQCRAPVRPSHRTLLISSSGLPHSHGTPDAVQAPPEGQILRTRRTRSYLHPTVTSAVVDRRPTSSSRQRQLRWAVSKPALA